MSIFIDQALEFSREEPSVDRVAGMAAITASP